MEQLLSLGTALNLPKLGAPKSMALGLVAAAILAVVAFVALRPSENMGLLYSGLDPAEAGKIGQKLDELKIPYEAKGDGGTILVPESEVAHIRMELAAAGLPHQGGAGYELLDSQSPMNMTSFMQRIEHVRAMEGELARTIATLNGVRSARVHLVLPEREGFSRETPKPTAAVTVVMEGPGRPTASQAAAIRLLVAGAVPAMQQDDVSVLDPNGVVLAADGGEAMAAGRIGEMKAADEGDLQRTVTNLLEPLVGRGKVRVAASVDLETARETEREQKFDPLSQIERSRQTQNDRDQSDDSKGQQPVTVGQNLPNQQVGAGSGNRTSSSSSHTGETVNYELSSTTTESVREPGALKRLTVAVAVDGVTDAKGAYTPQSPEELQRLTDLVRSAVGYNEKRGDQVTVESLHFVPVDQLGTSSETAAAGAQAGLLGNKYLLGGGAAGLVLLLGMMFMMRGKKKPEILPAPEITEAGRLAAAAEATEDLFSLSAVGVTARSPMLIQLQNMVDDRPEEVVTVLRGWITEGAT